MRPAIVSILILCSAMIHLSAMGQLPPQAGRTNTGTPKDSRPTTLPPGTEQSDEPQNTSEKTVTRTIRKMVNGQIVLEKQQLQRAAITDTKYRLGVTGYKSDSGFVVWGTTEFIDKAMSNMRRSPAREIKVDFRGNGTFTNVRIERGDIILSIDGFEITSPETIMIALDTAQTNKTEIEFLDYRSGNTYLGYVTPARIKN